MHTPSLHCPHGMFLRGPDKPIPEQDKFCSSEAQNLYFTICLPCFSWGLNSKVLETLMPRLPFTCTLPIFSTFLLCFWVTNPASGSKKNVLDAPQKLVGLLLPHWVLLQTADQFCIPKQPVPTVVSSFLFFKASPASSSWSDNLQQVPPQCFPCQSPHQFWPLSSQLDQGLFQQAGESSRQRETILCITQLPLISLSASPKKLESSHL